ncbi:hypothetical protein EWM64_g93 [Hericium alpestre]|uniref:Uncharacterized protein n=1 Tax=Hericium alpestre TaxID=135208 RepID=A0A4Z0ABY0_9AGAM|nr:hypothetical protein EWM64_g93 [Hericium alpestre]
MPAKYSHAKKRAARKPPSSGHSHHSHSRKDSHRPLDPLIDRTLTQAMTALSDLERCISRILLLRYEQDIARLFSTRLYCISLIHLPTIMMRCMTIGGPGWIAHNADCEEIKDFFRSAIAMDMRQAGERVATKSVLWSYTVLRHFAISNGVSVCRKRGLHSLHLLPHYAGLKAYLDALEAQPPPTFSKPAHLGPLTDGLDALEEACSIADSASINAKGAWDMSWRPKIRVGYERFVQTLWRIAHEFDPRGYGLVLREKLTNNWCECGCSTDHLGEVCERAVSEDEQENGVRSGKQREWDGRGGILTYSLRFSKLTPILVVYTGSGVFGWGTDEEEDIWEAELDFVGMEPPDDSRESDLSIGERMEWRYLRAEKEKELVKQILSIRCCAASQWCAYQGNVAFKQGDFATAAKYYVTASKIEPEMPHYQLNLAAAHLKLAQSVSCC